MPFEKQIEDLERRRRKALLMGGEKKIKKQHDEGKYTARERIDKLIDPGSFSEVGMFNHSDMPGMEEKSPADSKIGGYARINGRPVGLLAADFTVLGATSSRIASRKEGDIRETADRHGFPVIYLGEAGGARMPDIMGSAGLASYGGGRRDSFIDHMSRVRKTPLVMAVLGKCYGEPTWMACLADFVVMVKGTAMGVSGPRIVSIALGEDITDEELGGWELHGTVTGMADRVTEDEDECMQTIREYLSYMPAHNEELPPLAPVPDGSGENMPNILDLLPEKRNRTYDMNRILACVVDRDSLFPVKPLFGRTVITSLGRVDGRVIGIVANQPQFNAGAMDTDGIEKVMSFLCLCDSFNIPLVFFEDIPGFLVGREAERRRVGPSHELHERPGPPDGPEDHRYRAEGLRDGLLEYVRVGERRRFDRRLAYGRDELCRSDHRGKCGLRRDTGEGSRGTGRAYREDGRRNRAVRGGGAALYP